MQNQNPEVARGTPSWLITGVSVHVLLAMLAAAPQKLVPCGPRRLFVHCAAASDAATALIPAHCHAILPGRAAAESAAGNSRFVSVRLCPSNVATCADLTETCCHGRPRQRLMLNSNQLLFFLMGEAEARPFCASAFFSSSSASPITTSFTVSYAASTCSRQHHLS